MRLTVRLVGATAWIVVVMAVMAVVAVIVGENVSEWLSLPILAILGGGSYFVTERFARWLWAVTE